MSFAFRGSFETFVPRDEYHTMQIKKTASKLILKVNFVLHIFKTSPSIRRCRITLQSHEEYFFGIPYIYIIYVYDNDKYFNIFLLSWNNESVKIRMPVDEAIFHKIFHKMADSIPLSRYF